MQPHTQGEDFPPGERNATRRKSRLLAGDTKPRYTPFIHQPTEYKRRLIMLCCEIFDISLHLGDRVSSSVIGFVLR
jgi:hypothetical protein